MWERNGEASAVLVNDNLHGAIVPLAEVIPSASEVSHGRPAGTDTARPADTVTFALQSHEALHCLDRKTGSRKIQHPHYYFISSHSLNQTTGDFLLTFLPAWLLCRFMSARASLSFLSLASTKDWLKRMACATWSLQPPQSKEPLASCDEPFLVGSHEQESSSPWLQARARV